LPLLKLQPSYKRSEKSPWNTDQRKIQGQENDNTFTVPAFAMIVY